MELYRERSVAVCLILFTFHLLLFHNKNILSEILLPYIIQLTFCSLAATAEDQSRKMRALSSVIVYGVTKLVSYLEL